MQNKMAVQTSQGRVIAGDVTVARFIAALTSGAKSWQEAGDILVALRNEDEKVFDKILVAHSFLTQEMLEVFYHIGTRSLHPMALLLPKHVFNAVKGMNYDAQAEFQTAPVQVVTRMVGDKPVVVRKPINKLTPQEAKWALCRKGNVSVDKQVKKMAALAVPAAPKAAPVKVEPRKPVEVARFAVRRGPGGTWAFEKTNANPWTTQNIVLHEGQAVICLTEYKAGK